MFGRVAGRYDLLNHLLSFQVDRAWRAATAKRAAEILRRPDARVLDLCCGTGDLMLELEKRRRAFSDRSRDRKPAQATGSPLIFGSDFCHPMLVEANRKSARKNARTVVFEADALQLPLADASFDLITVAFGFRNFANYRKGLTELRRVFAPRRACLKFSSFRSRRIA